MNLAFMESSLTLSVSGTSSILEAQYFPPIELAPNKHYVLGLVELLTFNSIPNVDSSNNKFYVGKWVYTLPTGSYEIEDINTYLQDQLKVQNININIKPNNNTLRSEIECSHEINFNPQDSIGQLLGFTPRILKPYVVHSSDQPVTILKINALRVECNITTGAYINGKKVHTIHEFFPAVPPGYKIIEVPSQVIYLPVAVKSIDHLQLRIVDQDGNLVNFRGEVITIRLHIKQTT